MKRQRGVRKRTRRTKEGERTQTRERPRKAQVAARVTRRWPRRRIPGTEEPRQRAREWNSRPATATATVTATATASVLEVVSVGVSVGVEEHQEGAN